MKQIIGEEKVIYLLDKKSMKHFKAYNEFIKKADGVLEAKIMEYNGIQKGNKPLAEKVNCELNQLKKLIDRSAYLHYTLVEICEIVKNLNLSQTNTTKIIYINQICITICKFIEQYENDKKFYENIFQEINVKMDYKIDQYCMDNKNKLKKSRDKFGAHFDKKMTFIKTQEDIFSTYIVDEYLSLAMKFVILLQDFNGRIYNGQLIYKLKNIPHTFPEKS